MIEIGIRKMRIFLSIVEEGSFTKASLKHNISQPATTIAINQIEDILGVELFRRAGSVRHSELTEQGKEVLNVFSHLVQTHDDMMSEIDFASNLSKPKKIVAQSQYTDAFSSDWIETLIEIFGNRNITIGTDDRDAVIDTIVKRDGDVGLVDGYVDNELLDYIQIASDPIGILVNDQNMSEIYSQGSISWQDLPESLLILTHINSAAMNKIRSSFRRSGIKTDKFIETDSINIMMQMLRDPSRVALLPKCCVNGMSLDGTFRFIPVGGPSVEVPIGFVTPRGYSTRAGFSKFIDMSRELASTASLVPQFNLHAVPE